MADIQVRVTLRAANGVAEDNCVNTFAVSGADPFTDDVPLAQIFVDFYSVVRTGTYAVGSYINDTILRTDGIQVDLINSPGTPPNVPYYTFMGDLPAANSASCLPQESAVCLSMVNANYLTAANPGRLKGRVYIGPLTPLAGQDGGTLDVLRPSAGLVTALTDAATAMLPLIGTGGRAWAIWSRADAAFYEVTGGWVDNEFDTQRRRGRRRTARTFWG